MAKSISELILELIRSEINLGRAFASVSRSAYQGGNIRDGDIARTKAERVYSQAVQLAKQLPEVDSQTTVPELQRLQTAINWLSSHLTQSTTSSQSTAGDQGTNWHKQLEGGE